ncbi:MAG TPA: hypothetical protein VF756_04155 [Thermoanaerobaculia bacterium]
MKKIDTTAVSNLAELLDLAQEDTILLRTPEGREFILTEADDFEAEVESVRQNRELLDLLDERSRERKSYSLAEVKEKLGLG